MAIDPSIPLAAQPPQGFTLNSIAQLMQMQQQAQQAKQQRAIQNSLAAIYANPANLGPDGLPNAQAIQSIGRLSPQAAQELTTQKATVDEKQALTSKDQMEAGQAAQKNIQSTVRDPALNAYDQALASGKTPQQAQQIAQQIYSDGLDQLFSSGYIPDAMKQQVPQNFDPVRVRANSLSYKDRLAADQKQKDQDDTNTYRGAEIGLGRARLGVEEANLGMRKAEFAFNQSQAGKAQKQTNEGLPTENVAGVTPKAIDNLAHLAMNGVNISSMLPGARQGGGAVKAALDNRIAYLVDQQGGGGETAVTDYQQGKADTAGIAKSVRDFSTGTQGNAVRSLDVSIAHLSTLKDLSDAMKNHDYQAVNKLSNEYSKQTGAPAVTNFNAAKQIVGDEIVKGIVGAGGSAGDREKAQESIDAANSPEQLQGVIDTYTNLLGGQLGGLQQQYQAGTKRNDFGKFLTPETKKALNFKEDSDSKSSGSAKTVHWDDL